MNRSRHNEATTIPGQIVEAPGYSSRSASTDSVTADYDLIVIGGGAGGLGAARAAARRKARTLLVQHGPLGGDCTFTGCVPSKALIEAAARGEPFEQALAGAHRAVAAIATTESDAIIESEGIDVRHGWASFRSPTRLGQ